METSLCFICSSDKLFYDSLIPPLHPAQQLQSGQLYFVLPLTRMHYRLTASDMAALAVKASTAHSYDFRLRAEISAKKTVQHRPRDLWLLKWAYRPRDLPSELFNREISVEMDSRIVCLNISTAHKRNC
uniref:Uncharacterized protein n=1 Tax=Nelumbo nucifera TaxID=4432 RepID=A0A822YR55_NELNU|nr:TPA_asm: hypothetical protein HUJ06_007325 [Nelumbo nucifera]